MRSGGISAPRPSRRRRAAPRSLAGILRAEDARSGDEGVGPGLRRDRDRLDGDAAVHLQPDIEPARADRRARRRIFGIISAMKLWPPKPGSTVIISTWSNSGSSSRYGSSVGARLQREPGARTDRAQPAGERDGSAAASAWKVTENAPSSAYPGAQRSGS